MTISVSSSSSHHSSRSFEETSALFPIETNAVTPSPADSDASSNASPSAPLCDEKRDLPGGERARRERRVEVDGRGGDAEAVRPDEAGAVLADEGEELLLPLDALAADLRESGGDDDERAHAGVERLLGRLEHLVAGQADDREVDAARDLADGGVALHAGDRVALAVDGIRRAGEVARRGRCGRARRRCCRGGSRRRRRRRSSAGRTARATRERRRGRARRPVRDTSWSA